MGCLLLVLGLLVPRVAFLLLWIIYKSEWVNKSIFDFGLDLGGAWIIIPIIGFLFFPFTLIWVCIVGFYSGGEWTEWNIFFLIIAVLLDLTSGGGSAKRTRNSRRRTSDQ